MLGCLVGLAVSSALLGLMALLVRMPHPRQGQIRPSRLLRGCIALPFLLLALSIAGMILMLRYGGP